MDVRKDHIIHSRGGRVGAGVSSREDVQGIAQRALDAHSKNGIVLFFHGGLVDRSYAVDHIAMRLASRFSDLQTYPIFSVWESGFFESVLNNLGDIRKDKVFQELVKKTSEWVARKSGGVVVTRGGAGEAIDANRMRNDYDRWFNGDPGALPVQEVAPVKATFKGATPDEDELVVAIADEIELDPVFESTMAGLAVKAQRVPSHRTRGAGIEPRAVDVLVSPDALDAMFPPTAHVAKGGITWLAVARFVAKVVIGVIRRYRNKSDHGAYTTIVEEVLRAAYLDKVGQVIWNQMKKDASVDAFNDPRAVGDIVLNTWKEGMARGSAVPRITLIGHSTGALYINSWLERSAQLAPELSYDVVMLAPACRTEEFMSTMSRHGGRVNNFRMFAMKDAKEQEDRLVSIIYPRSLLYFVCGVVEGEVDVPLLGMERFTANGQIFNSDYMTGLRKYFDHHPARVVWSDVTGEAGFGSTSVKHGDFDNDEATLLSIEHLIKYGY